MVSLLSNIYLIKKIQIFKFLEIFLLFQLLRNSIIWEVILKLLYFKYFINLIERCLK